MLVIMIIKRFIFNKLKDENELSLQQAARYHVDFADKNEVTVFTLTPMQSIKEFFWLTKTEVPKGLKRFLDRYPNVKNAFVINEKLSEKLAYRSCSIQFLTFEEFIKSKKLVSSIWVNCFLLFVIRHWEFSFKNPVMLRVDLSLLPSV